MESKAPDAMPTTRDVWMRGVFMLLLIIGITVGQWLLNILAFVQFLWLPFPVSSLPLRQQPELSATRCGSFYRGC